MQVSDRLSAFLRISAAFLALPLAMHAAPITGTVTNRTVDKPAAGDTVTLIRLTTAMEDMTSVTTDAHGHFTLDVPDSAMHLIRVTHDKASYFAPAPPNTHDVAIDVYDAAPVVEGVATAVEELHVEATADKLQIVEILQVSNPSHPARTQLGPNGFDFYLPPDAHIVRTIAMRDQLPVPASAVPAGEPGHYTFTFPIRPGETQFGIFYDMPYSGSASIPLHVPRAVNTLAVLVPSSMKFSSGRGANFAQQAATPDTAGTQTWTASQIPADATLSFSISGTGNLPSQQPAAAPNASGATAPQAADAPATTDTRPGGGLGNPLDPDNQRDPWGKYKWWILSGLVAVLAVGAALMLRRPAHTLVTAGEPAHVPPSGHGSYPSRGYAAAAQTPSQQTLSALKEELFTLETEHLQQRISDAEYVEHKAALEAVLRRVLIRNDAAKSSAATPTGVA